MTRNASSDLQEFYETQYPRGPVSAVSNIPNDDDFMCGQVLGQIRPYLCPGQTVLDLGCNNGVLSFYMARAGCTVMGVDLAHNAIDSARRAAAYHSISNTVFESMDFCHEWSSPDRFDLVLCSHVIEHVPDEILFLAKIAYALKHEGQLVMIAPTVYSPLYRTSMALRGRFEHDEIVAHLRRYSTDAILALIEGAGLRIQRVEFFDGPLRDWLLLWQPLRRLTILCNYQRIGALINRVDAWLAKSTCPAAVCVHAQKVR